MSQNTVKRHALCPCGSELVAKECCYPTKPPVNMPVPQYVRVDTVPFSPRVQGTMDDSTRNLIESHLTQSFQITLNIGNESGPGFLPRDQANKQIARVLGYGLDKYHLDKMRHEHALIGPLHSTKYHQQQCMYRLLRLERESKRLQRKQNSNRSNTRKINVVNTFQFEDLPLRAEFEAFTSRTSSALDALAQYVCKCLGRNPKDYSTHFKLTNYLKNQSNDGVEWLTALRNNYATFEEWSRQVVREQRDYVIHEGTLWTLEAGKGMSLESPFVSPSWQDKQLETVCVEQWRTLTEFVWEVRQTLLAYRFTT